MEQSTTRYTTLSALRPPPGTVQVEALSTQSGLDLPHMYTYFLPNFAKPCSAMPMMVVSGAYDFMMSNSAGLRGDHGELLPPSFVYM